MKGPLAFSKTYMLPFLPWYLAGFLLVMGTQATMVAIIDETRAAIDAHADLVVLPRGESRPGDEGPVSQKSEGLSKETVLPYVKHIALLGLFLFFVRILSRYLIFTPGRMIEFRIRNRFFHTLLHKPRNFFRGFETGDLISRASNDIGFIRAAYGYGVLQVVNVFSAFGFGIWAMWRMDPVTTLWIGLPMFSTLVLVQMSIRFLFNYWRLANEQLGEMSSFCLASFQGVSALKGYHAEPRFSSMFEQHSSTYLKTNLLITSVRSFIMPMVNFSGHIATFIVLWIIGSKIIEGDHTIGQVSAYMGYIAMVMPPLLSLGWMLNVFNRAVPAIERLQEIIESDPGPVSLTAGEASQPRRLAVKNLELGFSASDTQFHLRDISFALEPGRSLGIVGEVGSGKTALIEAILRFNLIKSGSITLDQTSAEDLPLAVYRANFSFASQRAFLFSTSLRNNLLLALPEASQNLGDEALVEALSLAGFTLDPAQFPKGLDTEVGEKGIMLSGGQRQRIALARCFLKPASIYILDDVLSAVDHDTERLILRNLKSMAKTNSYIIVSHRLSAVQWCDEILVLDEGRVVARGDHETLVNQAGYYQTSYQFQNSKGDL